MALQQGMSESRLGGPQTALAKMLNQLELAQHTVLQLRILTPDCGGFLYQPHCMIFPARFRLGFVARKATELASLTYAVEDENMCKPMTEVQQGSWWARAVKLYNHAQGNGCDMSGHREHQVV